MVGWFGSIKREIVYFLIAVLHNEELFDELITGWLDLGITDSTVIETTDSLQRISQNVPIFAGFRSLTSGGMRHNQTIFTAIQDKSILDAAINFLETLCQETSKPDQGIYYVLPMTHSNRLGEIEDA
jgi:nitrogen regulatory protein P-II 1